MFQVGQRVIYKNKLGTVVSVDAERPYPVAVRYDDDDEDWFAEDGREWLGDDIPSLFPIERAPTVANELLHEALIQLRYLNEKFGETGASHALISKIKTFLNV